LKELKELDRNFRLSVLVGGICRTLQEPLVPATKMDQASPLPGALLMLALSLVIPSVGAVQKYTGLFGLAAYVLAVGAALVAGLRFAPARLLALITARRCIWLAGATLVLLLGVFALVYPLANAGVVGGGTDRDEALNIAIQELLRGRYPYYPKTYLNAPISPLPGSLLLAAPFVLLGNSAYQNMFWIAAFYLMVARYMHDPRVAFLACWTVLGLSPLFWQEFVTGGDLLANSLFVCVFTLLTLHVHQTPSTRSWKKVAAALLLGIGLASRLNYLLVVLPIGAWLWRSIGRQAALAYMALTCITAACVTLPFYFYDPAGFSPLHTFRKVDQFGALLPFAGSLIIALSALTALLLALYPLHHDPAAFFRACALPQAVPILAGLIFYLLLQRLDYTFPGYGFSFLWFGLLSGWLQIARTGVLYAHSDAQKATCSASL